MFREEPFTLTWQVRSCSVPLPPRRRSGPFKHPYEIEGGAPPDAGFAAPVRIKSEHNLHIAASHQQLEVPKTNLRAVGRDCTMGAKLITKLYGGLAKATEPYNPSVSAFPGSLRAHTERGTEPRSPERSYARTAGSTPAAQTHAHCHGAHTGAGRGVR